MGDEAVKIFLNVDGTISAAGGERGWWIYAAGKVFGENAGDAGAGI